ncbi:MAG: hypothetical protein NE327_01630 [Lentisphaeraceae bacterium]|nr:hypothetical protein [Lentisphaeraceae bacterium]
MSCLCTIGSAKTNALFIIFALFSSRLLIAHIRKETNNDWRIYLILLLLSPVFIEAYYGH